MILDSEQLKALNPLVYEDFSPHVTEIFTVTRFGEESVDLPLTLIEATHEGPSPIKGYRDHFILIFRDSASGVIRDQSMCLMQHPVKGEISVFLIPHGQDAEGIYYQSVFS